MSDPITLPREVVERALAAIDGDELHPHDVSYVVEDLRQSLASAPQPVEDGVEVCPECHGAGCDMCSNGFIPTFPQANAKASAPQVGGELADISAAIGTVRFMDPPDGGDVSLAEQVRRMKAALDDAESRLAALSQEAEAVAWRYRWVAGERFGKWVYCHDGKPVAEERFDEPCTIEVQPEPR